MLFPTLGPSSLYIVWWPSWTKNMQIKQLLCWSDRTDTEHSTISGSNKEQLAHDQKMSTHIDILLFDQVFFEQAIGIKFKHVVMLSNFLVHQWLREHWFVHL